MKKSAGNHQRIGCRDTLPQPAGGNGMEMIQKAALAACVLGIIFSMAGSLFATEKFSRQMNIIFSLIMLLAIISPFMGEELDFDISIDESGLSSDYDAILEKGLDRQINANICDSLRTLLMENEIISSEITVTTNNLPDGGISITKAEVTLRSGSESEAERLLSAALGNETEISVSTDVYSIGDES